ncbi:MAG TPA: hypothetical protein VJP88_05245 [Caulobacteraceae bacterium]|nr:hypothetical protein [Caulobacteraceae bacterium]
MSILTDLLHGKITFSQAATQAASWAQKLVNANPEASAFAGATLNAVKQGASNMIMLADTELAQHFAQIVGGVETAADAALTGATGGKALPAVPLVNATIEQIASAGKAALDAWALQAKANLAAAPTQGAGSPTPPPPPPLPSPSSLSTPPGN